MESGMHQAPPQIQPERLGDYLDVMSKSVFQSGISWRVVESKWEGTRAAFSDFDPERIAQFGPDDLDRLQADTRLIRNRRKIEATVHNAQTMLDLEREHGSFQRYLRSHSDFDSLVGDLRKRFKFLGEMGAYHFLWCVSEPVPSFEKWSASHAGRRA